MKKKGRSANLEVPFVLAKRLWENVWQKFQEENADKISVLTRPAIFKMMQQQTSVGDSIFRKLKKEVEEVPEPKIVKLSRESINRLCDYLPVDIGESLRARCFLDPELRPLSKYFGRYRLYWRKKEDHSIPFPHSPYELELNSSGVSLTSNAGNAVGGLPTLINANLFFAAENYSKKSYFIFNVGTADEEQLGYIPGLCLTLNSDVTPISKSVLLVRNNETPDEALLNRYFDQFKESYYVKGIVLSWLLSPTPYRISGLFGNWYIYHVHNNIIRRGKICIRSERRINYEGTIHSFSKGHVEIFNNTNISISLYNSSKILHLLGRIGDQSDIGSRNHIRCIFSSTGKGGSTLKAGVSVMVRETETEFEDMTPAVIVSEDRSKFLSEADLKIILETPEDIEV